MRSPRLSRRCLAVLACFAGTIAGLSAGCSVGSDETKAEPIAIDHSLVCSAYVIGKGSGGDGCGSSSGSSSGSGVTCGVANFPCCNGTGCGAGSTCVNGTCAACGSPGEAICPGSGCVAGVPAAGTCVDCGTVILSQLAENATSPTHATVTFSASPAIETLVTLVNTADASDAHQAWAAGAAAESVSFVGLRPGATYGITLQPGGLTCASAPTATVTQPPGTIAAYAGTFAGPVAPQSLAVSWDNDMPTMTWEGYSENDYFQQVSWASPGNWSSQGVGRCGYGSLACTYPFLFDFVGGQPYDFKVQPCVNNGLAGSTCGAWTELDGVMPPNNLVADPSFENQPGGQLVAPWTSASGLTGVDVGMGWEMQGRNNAWMRGSTGWNGLAQTIALVQGQTYHLTGYFSSEWAPFGLFHLGVRDADGSVLNETVVDNATYQEPLVYCDNNGGENAPYDGHDGSLVCPSANQYYRLSVDIPVPWGDEAGTFECANAQCRTTTLYAGFYGNGQDEWVRLDNVWLSGPAVP
jgi:hypothetical protein